MKITVLGAVAKFGMRDGLTCPVREALAMIIKKMQGINVCKCLNTKFNSGAV